MTRLVMGHGSLFIPCNPFQSHSFQTVHYGAFWKKIGRFPILQATFFDFGSILVYYGRIELAFLPLLATTWVIYGQSLEIYYVN